MKEKLDVKRNAQEFAREHVPQGAGIAALVGVVLGYSVAGMFTRH
jgi:ElaB/YqjD/DUF883 family membrane-anchored ribosome-binding protein